MENFLLHELHEEVIFSGSYAAAKNVSAAEIPERLCKYVKTLGNNNNETIPVHKKWNVS